MSLSFNFRLVPSARQTNPESHVQAPGRSLTVARALRGDDSRNMKREKKKCVSVILCKTALQRPNRSTDMLNGNAAQYTCVSAAEPLNRHAKRQCRLIYALFSGRAAQVLFSGRAAQPTCSAAMPLNLLMFQRPSRSSDIHMYMCVCISRCSNDFNFVFNS